jgi:cyclopropane fatty-acyl-phospholipid synthase-like methyltransferase
MLNLADVKRTDFVYDLGCGDGRIVIAAAKTYGARGVGIDIDPERIREAEENAKKAGVELRPKLLRDLKPGARVVSNTFDMGD